jgi:hypothetical protein
VAREGLTWVSPLSLECHALCGSDDSYCIDGTTHYPDEEAAPPGRRDRSGWVSTWATVEIPRNRVGKQ